MVILGSLSPTDLQHREEASFTKRTDFSGVEPGQFQYHWASPLSVDKSLRATP